MLTITPVMLNAPAVARFDLGKPAVAWSDAPATPIINFEAIARMKPHPAEARYAVFAGCGKCGAETAMKHDPVGADPVPFTCPACGAKYAARKVKAALSQWTDRTMGELARGCNRDA